jgi:deoxyxylulose-5-phosphate synthase
MACEAMNSAGYLQSRMIVFLIDNGQVSAGGNVLSSQLSTYTSNWLVSNQDVRDFVKFFNKLLQEGIQDVS